MTQYIKLYSSSDYLVYSKYSSILTTVFITLTYGVGMPILFPIAAVTFAIMWVQERFFVAYLFKAPPSFDENLSNNALDILRYAPLLLLFNGYWMLGNQQVFNNVVNRKETSTSSMPTGHSLSTVYEVSQASTMLLIGIAIFFIILMQTYFEDFLRKYGFGFTETKIDVEEKLPHFWDAVKEEDCEWLAQEDHYYQNTYALDLVEEHTENELD